MIEPKKYLCHVNRQRKLSNQSSQYLAELLMGGKGIPDRWLRYEAVGKQINGTNFIAFKVPLKKELNNNVHNKQRFGNEQLLERVPNLGLIIDLTNTNRYYDPKVFEEKGVAYSKVMVPGHEIPDKNIRRRFCDLVRQFLECNPKKLIGVHCTHGVNRTGFLICYFMIRELNMRPKEAIYRFEVARGYIIERANYLTFLNEADYVHNESDFNNKSSIEPYTTGNFRTKKHFISTSEKGTLHGKETRINRGQHLPKSYETNSKANNGERVDISLNFNHDIRSSSYSNCHVHPYHSQLQIDTYNREIPQSYFNRENPLPREPRFNGSIRNIEKEKIISSVRPNYRKTPYPDNRNWRIPLPRESKFDEFTRDIEKGRIILPVRPNLPTYPYSDDRNWRNPLPREPKFEEFTRDIEKEIILPARTNLYRNPYTDDTNFGNTFLSFSSIQNSHHSPNITKRRIRFD